MTTAIDWKISVKTSAFTKILTRTKKGTHTNYIRLIPGHFTWKTFLKVKIYAAFLIKRVFIQCNQIVHGQSSY
jgi:hypothetical protein